MTYLAPATARSRLLLLEIKTNDTVPTVGQLEWVLSGIEQRLEAWLGYRPLPTEYTEKYTTDNQGLVLLWQYPVISVEKAGYYRDQTPGYGAADTEPLDLQSTWRQGRALRFGLIQTPVLVTYTAGFDPLPDIFEHAVFQVLCAALGKTGVTGDLSFLDEPVKDVASLSLPGGLSKTFRLGGGSGASNTSVGKGTGSLLDRLFAGLERYRRKIVC